MLHLGAEGAKTTRYVADGGIDVESLEFIAQVKNYTGSVSVKEVREFQGVASLDRRVPLYFTSGTYTAQAREFGEGVGMALFRYEVITGTLKPISAAAHTLLTDGLSQQAPSGCSND